MESAYVLAPRLVTSRTLERMATAPYGVRLIVGAAVTAIEETLKLPQTIVMYPMTLASNVAQMVMKMQQDLADLAIKGDSALEGLFPPKDEQPEWATFDEDLDAPVTESAEPRVASRCTQWPTARRKPNVPPGVPPNPDPRDRPKRRRARRPPNRRWNCRRSRMISTTRR